MARDRSLTAVLTAACSQDSYEVETATAGTPAEDGWGYIVLDDVIISGYFHRIQIIPVMLFRNLGTITITGNPISLWDIL